MGVGLPSPASCSSSRPASSWVGPHHTHTLTRTLSRCSPAGRAKPRPIHRLPSQPGLQHPEYDRAKSGQARISSVRGRLTSRASSAASLTRGGGSAAPVEPVPEPLTPVISTRPADPADSLSRDEAREPGWPRFAPISCFQLFSFPVYNCSNFMSQIVLNGEALRILQQNVKICQSYFIRVIPFVIDLYEN